MRARARSTAPKKVPKHAQWAPTGIGSVAIWVDFETGDKHMVDVGAHKKQGGSPNALDVPALGSDKGVAIAALSGDLNLWCPNGKHSVQAKGVQVSAEQGVDVKAGSELTLRGASGATLAAKSAGKYQGGVVKVGAG